MKFSINASLLGIAGLPAVSAGIGTSPAITTAPEPTRIAARATTSFYSFVTTPIPNNDRSIGMGLQREGTDEYYWLYCIDEPFTVRSGFAGCGNDDVYTTCSGRVASGIDGDEIRCDQQCVTHKVYKDLDVTTFTPLIGCGRGTSTMNLVRTSTGSNSPKTGGVTGTTSAATSAVTTGQSAGSCLEMGPWWFLVGLSSAVLTIL